MNLVNKAALTADLKETTTKKTDNSNLPGIVGQLVGRERQTDTAVCAGRGCQWRESVGPRQVLRHAVSILLIIATILS